MRSSLAQSVRRVDGARPRAHRAASSIAMPARMSAIPPSIRAGRTVRPRVPVRVAQHDLRPHPMSLSTKNSRDSNIFSLHQMRPLHCVAVTIAIDITSAGNAGHG